MVAMIVDVLCFPGQYLVAYKTKWSWFKKFALEWYLLILPYYCTFGISAKTFAFTPAMYEGLKTLFNTKWGTYTSYIAFVMRNVDGTYQYYNPIGYELDDMIHSGTMDPLVPVDYADTPITWVMSSVGGYVATDVIDIDILFSKSEIKITDNTPTTEYPIVSCIEPVLKYTVQVTAVA